MRAVPLPVWKRFGRVIFNQFEKRPMLMNSIVGGAVYGTAEIIAEANNPNTNLDAKRIAPISALGALEVGGLMTLWYNALDRCIGTSAATRVVMAKCAADQVFFATQADGLFLAVCAILDSNDLPHAIHEVKLTFLTTWLNDCAVWPLVNFIGFWQVPTKLVPTYMASMQLIWQLYLSMAQQKAAPVEAAALAGDMTSTAASRDLNASLRSRRSLSSKDLDQIFAQCDTDGSGGIDAGELRGALERCGIAASADDVKKMMKLGDLNGNGVVDRAEFKRLVQQKVSMENQEAVLWETVFLPKPKFTDTQLDNIFREFDRDGSGGIDAGELRGALERCGIAVSTDDVMKMMTFADLDGDSLVNRAEFTRLLHLTVDGQNQEAVLWKAAIARAVHFILQKGGIKGALERVKKFEEDRTKRHTADLTRDAALNFSTWGELTTPLPESDKNEGWRGDRADALRNSSIGLGILAACAAVRVLVFKL